MPTNVRRALGVLLCVVAALGAWLVSARAAAALRGAAEEQARQEVAASLQLARAALDDEGKTLGARAASGAELLRAVVAASTLAQLEELKGTLTDAFENEPWWHPFNAFASTVFYLGGQRVYVAPTLDAMPDGLDAVVADATTAGRGLALSRRGTQPVWLVSARVPEPNRQQAWGVLVLVAPVTHESLGRVAARAGANVALQAAGSPPLLAGPDIAAWGTFPAQAREGSTCCARADVAPGLSLVVGRNPEALLAAAEAQADTSRTIAFVIGALVMLAGVALASWPASRRSADEVALLKETAEQLRQSQEQLQRFSQSIAPATFAAHAREAPPASPAPAGDDDGLGSTQASVVQSRYEVIAPLGEGGMAHVSVAQVRGAEGFRRLFVLKRLRPEASEHQEIVNQFIDEARLGASLVHSNIIPVFDFGRDAQGYYLAQEYILGRDVAAVVAASVHKRQAALEAKVVSWLAAEALKALQYAHTKTDDRGRPLGLVHRDVSPNNLMLTARGELKLLDFGIVKSEQRLTKTQAGMVKGNLFYMSPEQARGLEVDPRADLFSLGLVLYFAATAQHLYTGQTQYELMTRAAAGLTDEDRRKVQELPATLRAFVARLLENEPSARFASAEEAAAAVPRPTAVSAEVEALVQSLLGEELRAETARLAAGGAA
jgi:type II secretory pathway pseudopilin PulG